MAVTQASKRIVKLTAAADVLSGREMLRGIAWVGPGAVGDSLVISDSGTGEIFSSKCSAINQGDQIMFPTQAYLVNNLTVTTLTSGYVLVYLD